MFSNKNGTSDATFVGDGISSDDSSPVNNTHNSIFGDDSDSGNYEASQDATQILKSVKMKYSDNVLIAQLNINSIRNKFDQLVSIIQGNVDILVITETKLDSTFPTPQFKIDGYSATFRLDRNSNSNSNGGGDSCFCKR